MIIFTKWLNKLLYWRLYHISNRNFLVIASVIVGIISSLAAVILKMFVHWLHGLPSYLTEVSNNHLWYIYLPLSGIIITVIVTKLLFKGKLEKGLGNILFAI